MGSNKLDGLAATARLDRSPNSVPSPSRIGGDNSAIEHSSIESLPSGLQVLKLARSSTDLPNTGEMDRHLEGAQIVVVCDSDDARSQILAAFTDIPGFSIRSAPMPFKSEEPVDAIASPDIAAALAFSKSSSAITVLIASRHPATHAAAGQLSDPEKDWPIEYQRSSEQGNLPNRFECVGGLTQGAIKRIKIFVDDNLPDPISLVDLAGIAGLSVCHFGRAFKQSVRVTPHRYIMGRRISEAARRLATSQDSISEIAFLTGFSDQSHMTRAFVKTVGTTPRNYRRAFR